MGVAGRNVIRSGTGNCIGSVFNSVDYILAVKETKKDKEDLLMNSFKNIVEHFFYNLKCTVSAYISLFVWWAIAYIVELWFYEHIFFSTNIFERGWQIIKGSIIPIILWAVIFTILRGLVEKHFFGIYTEKDGLHRKGNHLYNIYTMYKFVCYFLAGMIQVVFQFSELKKSLIVMLVVCVISLLISMRITLNNHKKLVKWIEEQKNTDKVICAYITSYDFYDTMEDYSFGKMLKANELFKKSVNISEVIAIYETDNTIVCPYWIYKDYLCQYTTSTIKRLIIVVDGIYMDNDSDLIGCIADEFLDNGYSVFNYNIIHSGCCDAIGQRPVHSIYKSEVALDILSKREIYKEIPYFEEENFKLPYEIDKDVYLKYYYLYNELVRLSREQMDLTAKFYHLLTMIGYVWHYRALYSLAVGENPQRLFADKSIQSSMGLWNCLQGNISVIYNNDKTINAYRLIKSVLSGRPCNVKKIKYKEMCDILTQLRNRYVGHGTMAFSVSEKLFDAIKILAYEIINIFFHEQGCVLRENMVIKEEVPYLKIKQEDGLLCQMLLSGYIKGDEDIYEYLDYQSGDVISNAKVTYLLDYVEDEVK